MGAASSDDAVKIMTIHKSKGLEFPVVFVCDTSRRFNDADLKQTVLVHPELGLGAKIYDTDKASRGKNAENDAAIHVPNVTGDTA